MTGRCFINKGACFVTFSLVFLTVLLLNSLSSSDSINFSNKQMGHGFNYGIIIDAGSTGSRLFLYSWTSASNGGLIDVHSVMDESGKPVVRKVAPGLSTFADRPEAAPEYIKPLLDYASKYVPKERRELTPVFIFATAGMRLLSLEKQQKIIRRLQNELPKLTNLNVSEQNIKVITGKWEGIYSWIAVNYMLGRFNQSAAEGGDIIAKRSTLESILPTTAQRHWASSRPKTAGMVDMGGASTQIAFELPLENVADNSPDENVEFVNLGHSDDDQRFLYRIFVTTFLGFGVNEGAKKYEKLLWKKLTQTNLHNSSTADLLAIADGCLPVGFLKLSYVDEEDKQFVRKGSGEWDKCVDNIALLLFEDFPKCSLSKSCFFGGVKVPPGTALSHIELYGFSEYWFSVEDVLSLGGVYDHDIFEAKAKQFCHQTWRTIKNKMREKLYPKADVERLETQCFKSAWIHAILHNGFYVDEFRHNFRSAFRIDGQEVQWALGAIIYQMRKYSLAGVEQRHWYQAVLRQKDDSVYGWPLLYLTCIITILCILLWRVYQPWRRVANCRDPYSRYKKLGTTENPV